MSTNWSLPTAPIRLYKLSVISALAAITGASAQTPSIRIGKSSQAAHIATAPQVAEVRDVVTVVPFQLYHGLIFVTAQIDGRKGNFLIDTGGQLVFLNRTYVKLKRDSTGIDTAGTEPATAEDLKAFMDQKGFNVHTMRIGTLTHRFDATDAGRFSVNAAYVDDSKFQQHSGLPPMLGLLGLPAFRAFETVIDYTHKRLILIKLDSAGNRLAPVPAYTPDTTLPLYQPRKHGMFMIAGLIGGKPDTLLVDTGDPDNSITPETRMAIAAHVLPDSGPRYSGGDAMMLDQMDVGGKTYHNVPVSIHDAGGYSMDILGYPFLSQFGVVGFNFRKSQIALYR